MRDALILLTAETHGFLISCLQSSRLVSHAQAREMVEQSKRRRFLNYRSCWSLILVGAVMMLTTACAAPPVPTATPTVVPRSTVAPATATIPPTGTTQPTATIAPSATAQPTNTVVPTATPRPATSTPAPTVTVQATATKPATPTAAASSPASSVSAAIASSSASSSGQSNKVDLTKIFPPGNGSNLLLNNCTSCHSFVCAVKGQRTTDQWASVKLRMREKVSSLSDADFNAIFEYLQQNFNDTKPEPELPPELKDLSCSAPA